MKRRPGSLPAGSHSQGGSYSPKKQKWAWSIPAPLCGTLYMESSANWQTPIVRTQQQTNITDHFVITLAIINFGQHLAWYTIRITVLLQYQYIAHPFYGAVMQNVILATFNEKEMERHCSAYNPYLYVTQNIQNHTDKLTLCICTGNV